MPLIPEEPQIHESAQGPRATPATGRTASTPRPVPGPRPRPVPGPRSAATPRPGHPGPGPARPAPSERSQVSAERPAAAPEETRSVPQIQLIPASVDGALDAAEEAVDLLLDSGRAPGDILVLTTGEQHPWATHELSFGENSYWQQHDTGEDVFFADASAVDRAKARPVVVVALNGGDDGTVERVLPTARERAVALLVVCGDPQRVNSVLGAGV
ncbi:hypothetical protein ACFT9I_29330 [Streptomyces sp. NPDC057137]|uniref:hypothetical protein n=1 Tax=Streptomyces sp. NPDC057137 TaxID=3346030 RepID=UPI00363C5F27